MKKKFSSLAIQIPIVVNIFITLLLIISIFTLVRISKKAIIRLLMTDLLLQLKDIQLFLILSLKVN